MNKKQELSTPSTFQEAGREKCSQSMMKERDGDAAEDTSLDLLEMRGPSSSSVCGSRPMEILPEDNEALEEVDKVDNIYLSCQLLTI